MMFTDKFLLNMPQSAVFGTIARDIVLQSYLKQPHILRLMNAVKLYFL